MITTLDALVVATVSALPSPTTALAGAVVYYSGALYYCDGTQWIAMTGGTQDELKIDYSYVEM